MADLIPGNWYVNRSTEFNARALWLILGDALSIRFVPSEETYAVDLHTGINNQPQGLSRAPDDHPLWERLPEALRPKKQAPYGYRRIEFDLPGLGDREVESITLEQLDPLTVTGFDAWKKDFRRVQLRMKLKSEPEETKPPKPEPLNLPKEKIPLIDTKAYDYFGQHGPKAVKLHPGDEIWCVGNKETGEGYGWAPWVGDGMNPNRLYRRSKKGANPVGSREKPPLGVLPERLWKEQRYADLERALADFGTQNKPEWVAEFNKLKEELFPFQLKVGKWYRTADGHLYLCAYQHMGLFFVCVSYQSGEAYKFASDGTTLSAALGIPDLTQESSSPAGTD